MRIRIWLLLSLFAAGITCLYVFRILGPWEHFVDVEGGNLKAQMGDLYPRWLGTRELLLHGRNPYGPEVSHEIQMAYYGHPIDQQYGTPGAQVIDEQRFVYPVYVVFLLAPTVYMDFPHTQVWAAVILAMLIASSVPLWMDVLRWKLPPAMTAAIMLFVLSSPQIVQGLRLRQLGLLVGFLLALSTWCICRNHLAIAGAALALSTIKPQMIVLPLAWFLLWSVSALPRRWPLLAGFGASLAALAGMGELVLPGWPRFFLGGLAAYRRYFPATSLVCVALGNRAGVAASAIVVIGLLAWAWRNRQVDAGSQEFIKTLALFFLVAALVLPLLFPFNQVLVLLPVMMVARDWMAVPRLGRRIFAFVLASPWIVCVALLMVPPRLNSPNRLPLLPAAITLFLPFVLVLLLATARPGSEALRQLATNDALS
jgi:hypothetical protein